MGLAKSYFIGNKKICIYNTVRGQENYIKKKNLSCPLNLNKIFKEPLQHFLSGKKYYSSSTGTSSSSPLIFTASYV